MFKKYITHDTLAGAGIAYRLQIELYSIDSAEIDRLIKTHYFALY